MNLRNIALAALLIPLLVTQTGCITALAGAAIRHAKVTASSLEKVSFASPREAVGEHVVKALQALGSVTSGDSRSSEVVGVDGANLYKYTVGFLPAEKGSPTQLSVQVELIGDWEKAGWTTTKEKSTVFVDSIAASLGAAPVRLAAKATAQE